MGYTKRQLVLAAMAEIGLSSYSFDLSTDQLEQALYRLDSMVAAWGARGIRLGYPLPGSPEASNIYAEPGLPDWAWDAVVTNLAVRIAPSYGKQTSPDTKATARELYNTLLGRFAVPPEIQRDTLPAGAGHKALDRPFIEPDEDTLVAGPDSGLEFN